MLALFCCSPESPSVHHQTLTQNTLQTATMDTAPPPDQYAALYQSVSVQHFGEPYEWQVRVGSTVIRLHAVSRPVRLLCVQGTGKGKSMLYQTLSAVFKGVTLYISLLLTFAADQVNKLMSRTRYQNTRFVPIAMDTVKTRA